MKVKIIYKKLLIFSLLTIINVSLFTGCQNKSTTSSSSNGNRQQSMANYKENIETNLKDLVDKGTISKDQEDKIITALTSSNGFGGNGQPRQNGQAQASQNSQNGQTQPTQNSKNSQQRTNPLSKLVSDGVITQSQADAVMQKIRGNRSNRTAPQPSTNTTT